MRKSTHNGIHYAAEYSQRVNIEPIPKSYKGAKLVWIVAHGIRYNRKYSYFFTKPEAIEFSKSNECEPHEYGSDIYIYWMPSQNAVLNSSGEIVDVRNK